MFSTIFELLGFAAITCATYLAAGLMGALYVGGVCLLLIGYAIEDQKALMALGRLTLPWRRLRARLQVERGSEPDRSLKVA